MVKTVAMTAKSQSLRPHRQRRTRRTVVEEAEQGGQQIVGAAKFAADREAVRFDADQTST